MDSSFWKAGAVKENRKNRTSDKTSFFGADVFLETDHGGSLQTRSTAFMFHLQPLSTASSWVFRV
jgi:hypothetical protein